MIPIFVVLYKNPDVEQACLRAVRAHTDLRRVEVVVYDNGPENRNLGAVWNAMIDGFFSHCRSEADPDSIGVLLNTDCFVTPGWLEKLERVIRVHPKIGFVGPMTNNCGSAQKAPGGYDPDAHAGEVELDRFVSGFCLMFRRAAWEEGGRFPEDGPFYGQESALIWNARRRGWRTAIVRDCWVRHLGGASVQAAEARGEMGQVEERVKGKVWFAEYRKRMGRA